MREEHKSKTNMARALEDASRELHAARAELKALCDLHISQWDDVDLDEAVIRYKKAKRTYEALLKGK